MTNIVGLELIDKNIFHMTLFQGTFDGAIEVIDNIRVLELNLNLRTQVIKGLNLWSDEWVFLNFWELTRG